MYQVLKRAIEKHKISVVIRIMSVGVEKTDYGVT